MIPASYKLRQHNLAKHLAEQAVILDVGGGIAQEASFPMILHQKLSVVIAQEAFLVQDEKVLSAIGCHTTLKANASLNDKLVFVADKIAWDQTGTPPYLAKLLQGLELSIEAASLAYLDYLWSIRDSLRVLHPWAIAAREQLLALKS